MIDDPLQVGGKARLDRKREEFRAVVGVQFGESDLEGFDRLGGLDQEDRLSVVMDLPLPAVDRARAGEDVHAGGEPLFDEGAGETGRLVGGRGRDTEVDQGSSRGGRSGERSPLIEA